MHIVNVKEYPDGIEKAAAYIHDKWGSSENYQFYFDAIVHSSEPGRKLPKFFLLLDGDAIAGCYGLVTNDFISRHDLYPWFACLYIEEGERGKELGKLLMEHAEGEAKKAGFPSLYLTTDHDGYYERYGWRRIEDGFEPSGKRTRIYEKKLQE